MLRARQSSHVENDDVGQIELEDSVGYAEYIDVEKDDYDHIPADRDTINHGYLVLTSVVKGEIKQTNNVVHHQNIQPDSEVHHQNIQPDNEVHHQNIQPYSEIHQTKQSVLRLIFLIMLCIIITASVTAVATFFATKHAISENNKKFLVSCSHEPCDNGGACVNGACLCNDGFAGSNCEIDINQTCKYDANTLIPHPNICQMYHNCSQAVSPLPRENTNLPWLSQNLRPAYLHECPYPDLFSTNMSCQNYTKVKCGYRYETKNYCDYLAVSTFCYDGCEVCRYFTRDCVGFTDGIHRNRYNPTPQDDYYFECQDERNIYSGPNPCPTNMAPYNGKCTDLFEIQPSNWQSGYAIDCSNRTNGNYKSEHVQRCDMYYTCVNGNFTLTYCDSELVFDSKLSYCQNKTNVCTPCGSVVSGC